MINKNVIIKLIGLKFDVYDVYWMKLSINVIFLFVKNLQFYPHISKKTRDRYIPKLKITG